jgi:Ca2+-binding EF-hand superfamily protein
MQRLGKTKATGKAVKAKDIDEETLSELKEAFKIFDSKNTGTISPIQVKSMPENLKLS